MKILIGCEFSQVVCNAFREKGHEAYSCDIIPTIGNPEWHIEASVLDVLNDGWDMAIFHPPCTYISNMSNCRIKEPNRMTLREEGMTFFMKLVNANILRIAIENPRGLPERAYRKPDQIIQPYHFGHPASKQTCLWLKNLPLLKPTDIVEPYRKWDGKRWRTWVDTCKQHNGKFRSITFKNIAEAMANQWSNI